MVEAVDGEGAVANFIDSMNSIHLVIFDVVMPKKDATAACDKYGAFSPDVPALFTRGSSPDIVAGKGVKLGAQRMYQPIAPHLLLSKLRELLPW